jgi:hypothetical protein
MSSDLVLVPVSSVIADVALELIGSVPRTNERVLWSMLHLPRLFLPLYHLQYPNRYGS